MATGGFKRPSKETCLEAIGIKGNKNAPGDYELLHTNVYGGGAPPHALLSALVPDSEFFKAIPRPGSSDWLACHKETGQSFIQFTRAARNIPDSRRKVLYILPVKFFENDVPEDITLDLQQFASFFFGMEVKLMKKVSDLRETIPSRINEYTENVQVDAGKILDVMKAIVPPDAFCVGALTLCDIYPKDDWNFVFGLATLGARVGVYSLARLMPGFPDEQVETANLTSEHRSTLLLSACRLMCHEMCHMFGMKHCTFFHCLMNGSNHFDETNKKPLHLCPVCLRKLHLACGFDLIERYEHLKGFCAEKKLLVHADWLQRRLQKLEASRG